MTEREGEINREKDVLSISSLLVAAGLNQLKAGAKNSVLVSRRAVGAQELVHSSCAFLHELAGCFVRGKGVNTQTSALKWDASTARQGLNCCTTWQLWLMYEFI